MAERTNIDDFEFSREGIASTVQSSGSNGSSSLDTPIDLSGVSEEINYEAAPNGDYNAIVKDVQFGPSQAGNDQFTFIFTFEFEGKRRQVWYYVSIDPEFGLPRLKRTVNRIDPTILENNGSIIPSKLPGQLKGKSCKIRVGTQVFEGKRRNNVKDLVGKVDMSFLDD